jgi:hypothetical protein
MQKEPRIGLNGSNAIPQSEAPTKQITLPSVNLRVAGKVIGRSSFADL